MAILGKFVELIRKDEKEGIKKKARHVAITTDGVFKWAYENKKSLAESHYESNLTVKNTIKTQVKLNVPITTFYLLQTDLANLEHLSVKIDALIGLFADLLEWDFIKENSIKISVFGKWYDLPGRIVDPIKNLLDATKDYDNFFVNFCINYNGQDEIVDACKIISMKAKTEKIDVASITRQDLRDNIYTSDFLPPDLIIKNGFKQKLHGFLLWDASNTSIYFTKRLWPDFRKDDFESALKEYEKEKI
jgi:undecaprenyl diphosphate synthase